MQLFHQEVWHAPHDVCCQKSEGIGEPGGNVGIRIARIIVQIQGERSNLRAIVRIASNIGYTPAEKRSHAIGILLPI